MKRWAFLKMTAKALAVIFEICPQDLEDMRKGKENI